MSRVVEVAPGARIRVPDHVTDQEARAAWKRSGLLPKREGATTPEEFPSIFGEPGVADAVSERRRMAFEELIGAPVARGQEVNRPGLRFDVGRTVFQDDPVERLSIIQKALGLRDEDILISQDPQDPERVTFLLRPPGSEEFIEFDSPELSTISDLAEEMAPLFSGEVAGGIAGFMFPGLLLPRLLRGGTALAARAAGTFVGSGGGVVAESEIERMLGREFTNRRAVAQRALEAALLNTIAEGAGELFLGGVGVARGRGFELGLDPEQAASLASLNRRAQEAGLPLLTLGDMSPGNRNISALAARTSPRAAAFHVSRLNKVLKQIDSQLKDVSVEDLPTSEVERVTRRMGENIKRDSGLPIQRVPESAISEDAALGLQSWETLRRDAVEREALQRVNRSTRAGVRLHLDTSNEAGRTLKERAARLRMGVVGRAEPDSPLALSRARVRALGVEGSFPSDSAVQTIYAPDDKLIALIDAFRALPTELRSMRFGDETISVFDQINAIRRQAFSMTDSGTAQDQFVDEFIEILDDTMASATGVVPQPGENTGDFITRARRMLAKKKTTDPGKQFGEDVLRYLELQQETDEVLRAVRSRQLLDRYKTNPEGMGFDLIRPTQPDRVLHFRRMLTEAGEHQRWDNIRMGYVARLMDSPGDITRELDNWNRRSPKALRALFSEQEEEALRTVSREFRKLDSGPLGRMIQDTSDKGAMLREVILSNDISRARSVVSEAGGKDSPMGRVLRRAVFQSIRESAETEAQGLAVMSTTATRDTVRKYLRSPALKEILTKKEMELLEALPSYLSLMPNPADFGASIAGVGTASKVWSFNPLKTLQGMGSKAGNFWAHTLLNTGVGPQLLRLPRAGPRYHNTGFLRPLAIATSSAIQSAEQDAIEIYGEDAEPDTSVDLATEMQRVLPEILGSP